MSWFFPVQDGIFQLKMGKELPFFNVWTACWRHIPDYPSIQRYTNVRFLWVRKTCYPPVNSYSYWNWPISSGFAHQKMWFSIVMLVYQRVMIVASNFNQALPGCPPSLDSDPWGNGDFDDFQMALHWWGIFQPGYIRFI